MEGIRRATVGLNPGGMPSLSQVQQERENVPKSPKGNLDVRDAREIPQFMERILSEIQIQGKLLAEVADRLGPVMHPFNDTTPDRPSLGSSTIIGRSMADYLSQLQHHNDILRAVLECVEV